MLFLRKGAVWGGFATGRFAYALSLGRYSHWDFFIIFVNGRKFLPVFEKFLAMEDKKELYSETDEVVENEEQERKKEEELMKMCIITNMLAQ